MTKPQETADLVRFTEDILNGKLHFLCSVTIVVAAAISYICREEGKVKAVTSFTNSGHQGRERASNCSLDCC